MTGACDQQCTMSSFVETKSGFPPKNTLLLCLAWPGQCCTQCSRLVRAWPGLLGLNLNLILSLPCPGGLSVPGRNTMCASKSVRSK